jgi:hypothetical protein
MTSETVTATQEEVEETQPKRRIIEVVTEHADELHALAEAGDYRALWRWGAEQGWDSRSGGGHYKKALAQIGIDYNGMRDGAWQAEDLRLAKEATHRVELWVNYAQDSQRFVIARHVESLDQFSAVWFGKEKDPTESQAAGELDVAKKACFLAKKVSEAAEVPIELHLHVPRENLANDQQESGKKLKGEARKLGVALTVEFPRDCDELLRRWPHIAKLYTRGEGDERWRSWKAKPIQKPTATAEEVEVDPLAARVRRVHRDRVAWEEKERETLREEETRATVSQGRER